jgi:hypothetical protein
MDGRCELDDLWESTDVVFGWLVVVGLVDSATWAEFCLGCLVWIGGWFVGCQVSGATTCSACLVFSLHVWMFWCMGLYRPVLIDLKQILSRLF